MTRSIDQRRVNELLDQEDSELESLFGIEIYEDCVYDPVEDREFDSLQEWAEYTVELEQHTESFIKRHNKYDQTYDE